ncbi:hypothetical protein [Psychrobacillus phage Perkons]|nr:hypothetical protein [Psychrobacillus phage Perkons]
MTNIKEDEMVEIFTEVKYQVDVNGVMTATNIIKKGED